jgi:ADP-dependent NAD(P)H-hydrate dehydratase / NAD(P)H-hydrate epimerase
MAADARAGGSLTLDDETCAQMLPARDEHNHKGSHGTLLCVCGSAEYVGAALLAAAAATRAGAGLVALVIPAALHALFAGRVPEAITLSLPAAGGEVDPEAAIELLAGRMPTALVIGCGLRESEDYRRLVLALLHQPPSDPDAAGSERLAPAVVDGGALNLLARSGEWWVATRRRCVLTPHPGEFARLTGRGVGTSDDERVERTRGAAAAFAQTVVLKGARTVIGSPDGRTARSPFANPALATAGTGDVLAGLIGALLAQGMQPFEAACLGVYLHGLAGERVRARLGDVGLVASDLPYEIALARHELSGKRAG